jgi:hypothetical protein
MGSAMDRKLMWDIRGFDPKISKKSVLSISGIGWIVLDPKKASLPANLLVQSCVPELKFFRISFLIRKELMAGPAVELNASGLPV